MGFLLFSRLGRWDGALVVTLGMLLRLINSRFIIIIIIIITNVLLILIVK